MALKVIIDTQISLNEILGLGQDVTRTPHVGSECLHGSVHEQLAGVDGNIVNLYYDRTTKKDIYHHPSYIIVGGRKIKIAPTEIDGKEVLTTHLGVSDIHMFRLDLIYPSQTRMTYSEYIQKYIEDYKKLVDVLGEKLFEMGLWTRYVQSNGVVEQRQLISYNQIDKEWVFQVTSEKSGWILPNIMNILAEIYIDDQRYRSGFVYSISGAEMYKYINSLIGDMNKLWGILVAELGASENIVYKMFPTGNARFAAFNSEDFYKLNLLFETREKIFSFNKRKAEFYKKNSGAPDKNRKAELESEGIKLIHEYQDLCWENRDILYSMSDANFTSQYDMGPGQKLHIHEFCLNAPISELDKMIDEMQSMIKKREKRLRKFSESEWFKFFRFVDGVSHRHRNKDLN